MFRPAVSMAMRVSRSCPCGNQTLLYGAKRDASSAQNDARERQQREAERQRERQRFEKELEERMRKEMEEWQRKRAAALEQARREEIDRQREIENRDVRFRAEKKAHTRRLLKGLDDIDREDSRQNRQNN